MNWCTLVQSLGVFGQTSNPITPKLSATHTYFQPHDLAWTNECRQQDYHTAVVSALSVAGLKCSGGYTSLSTKFFPLKVAVLQH